MGSAKRRLAKIFIADSERTLVLLGLTALIDGAAVRSRRGATNTRYATNEALMKEIFGVSCFLAGRNPRSLLRNNEPL